MAVKLDNEKMNVYFKQYFYEIMLDFEFPFIYMLTN